MHVARNNLQAVGIFRPREPVEGLERGVFQGFVEAIEKGTCQGHETPMPRFGPVTRAQGVVIVDFFKSKTRCVTSHPGQQFSPFTRMKIMRFKAENVHISSPVMAEPGPMSKLSVICFSTISVLLFLSSGK